MNATQQRPDFRDMIAVGSGSKIKALGYLVWFSVPDEAVSLRRLRQQLAVHGLSPDLAPKDTKAINTFKKAVREQDGRKRENGHIRENDVALVTESFEQVVYQVSTLKRDLAENVVDYPKALRVIFNKDDEEIRFNPLREVPRADVLPVMEAIQEFYDKNASKVTGARVRAVVRNYLKSSPSEERGVDGLNGENLRGKAGGIYFIPARHRDQLQALAETLDELYKGKAYLHYIPLADSASEREIIRRHHVANTQAEMKEAIQELREILDQPRDRAIRSDVAKNHLARYHALRRRIAEYTAILEDEQEEVMHMGELMKKQLRRLPDVGARDVD